MSNLNKAIEQNYTKAESDTTETNTIQYIDQLTPVGSIHTFPTAAVTTGCRLHSNR